MAHRNIYRARPLGTLLGRRERAVRLHSTLRTRQPVASVGLWLVLGLVLFVLVGGAAFYARLLQGPIDLAFLTPRIKAAIDRELGGEIGLAIGGVVLERGGRTGLTVRLRDLSILDSNGEALAVIDRAEVGLDPVALLSGEIAPRRVDLLKPRLHVERREDGSLVAKPETAEAQPSGAGQAAAPASPTPQRKGPSALLALLDPAALAGPTRSFAAAVDSLLSLAGGSGSRLETISLVGGDVSYVSDGEHWLLPDVNARLERGSAGGRVVLEVQAGQAPARYKLALAAWREAGGRQLVSLDVAEVPQVHVELDESPSSGLNKVLIVPQAKAEIVLVAGEVSGARARIQLSARQDEPGVAPVLPDGELILALDTAGRRVVLEPSRFTLGRGGGVLSGALVWPETGETGRQGIAFGLETRDLVLASNDVDAPPLPVERLAVSGAVLPNAGAIRLDSVAAQSVDVELAAQGMFTLGENSPGLKLQMTATPMDVDVLKQLWPGFVAPGARNWLVENVEAGRIGAARFAGDYPPEALHSAKFEGKPLAVGALDLTFDVEGAAFRHFRDLPAIYGTRGVGRLGANTFRFDASTGEIQARGGERLTARSGIFDVPMIHGDGVLGRVRVALVGRSQALVDLARSTKSIKTPEAIKSLGRIGGEAKLDIAADMTMKTGMTEEDVNYLVSLELAELSIPQAFEQRNFEKGAVKVSFAPERVEIGAKGLIDGVPATLDLRSDKAPSAKALGAYAVTLLLDEKSGPKFGLDLGHILSGPALAKIEGRDSVEGLEKVSLDITNARLAPEGLGILKPAGRRGEISFRPVSGPNGKTLRDLEVTAEDLAVRGTVTLGANGEMQGAEFNQFKLGRGEGAFVSLKKQGSGAVATIRGKSFDVVPLLKAADAPGSGGGGGGGPDGVLNVALDVERLLGHGGEEIRNASFRLVSRGKQITSFEGSGRFGSGATLQGSVGAEGQGGRQLTVDARDAGALLRFLDVYPRLQGGQLTLRARLPSSPTQTMPGVLAMQNFRIVDDPGLKKLASQTKEGEAAQQASTMPFDRLRVVFDRVPGRTAVQEGVASGPAAGATFRGMIDHRADNVDLTGTFVPVYALNNIFQQIPLVGPLLGGRKGEGLLGVTFAMRGKTADPGISINPLSAIAPGVFRQIFEYDPSKGQSSAAPAPASE